MNYLALRNRRKMAIQEAVYNDPLPPLFLLLSQRCWAVVAGNGTGAQVSLHFGRKLTRSRVIDNPEIIPELRTHLGEAILFIECKWSLSSKGKTLFDSEAEEDSNEKMERSVTRLLGASVRQVEVTMPPKRIAFTFDNGTVLTLDADEQQESNDLHDNFTFSFGYYSFVIGPDLGLRVIPRKGILPILGYEIITPQQWGKSGTALPNQPQARARRVSRD